MTAEATPATEPPPELARDAEWRRLDIRMLLVHPVNEVFRFLPLLIGVFFLGSRSDSGLIFHVAGIAIPIVLGVVRFLSTRFRITGTQIELRRGLISTSILTAPLDRVRTVELTASPIHRVLGLAKVQIGTGSAAKVGAEKLELDSLSAAEASSLRGALLHRSQVLESSTVEGVEVAPDDVLLVFDPGWVRYAPLTTSGLVIAVGALGAASQFMDRIVNWVADRLDLRARLDEVPLVLSITAGVIVALVVVSMLAALGYLLTNWGFTVSRDRAGRSFNVRRGMLTTRETSLERSRVRGLEVHEPLGLRLAGGGRLSAIVTGLGTGSGGTTPIAPAAPRRVVLGVGEAVLEETGPFTAPLIQHGPVARRRRYTRALGATAIVPLGVLVGVLLGDAPAWLLVPAVIVLALALPLAADRYARLGHALTERYLIVRSGTFRGRRDALQRSGIIGWNVRQSWFQKRAGVVQLTATSSAGKQAYSAYDVPEATAIALADEAVPGLVSQFLN